jgi:BirA family biotin operon repressor/biotin-[acetyl-CoA-carboxylase] ligase
MLVYTDSIRFTEALLPRGQTRWSAPVFEHPAIQRLCRRLCGSETARSARLQTASHWRHLFVVESAAASHYDLLMQLSRAHEGLPDRVLCVAEAGRGLHGSKGRPWAAARGNIHLSAHLAPGVPIAHRESAFTVLAAVSVIDAIDRLPGLAGVAGIKWVNDVLVGDAKVGGVLSYVGEADATRSTAVLGIGLNVEAEPQIERTRYVPRVGALRRCVPDPAGCTLCQVFEQLLAALDHNYDLLLRGAYGDVLERYRRRSLVVGREVAVYSGPDGADRVIARGRVVGLDDDLGLLIEGRAEPVTNGRVVLAPHGECTTGPNPGVAVETAP